jgi:hypothetical protein
MCASVLSPDTHTDIRLYCLSVPLRDILADDRRR